MRILIVEDDPVCGHLLVELLAAWGYSTDWSVDGYSAIQKSKLAVPTVLLCDYFLNDLDGLTVCKVIRNDLGKDVPAIVITAALPEDAERISHEAAAIGVKVLRKPFNPADLRNLLEALAAQLAATPAK